ncbi:xanthine dehydrogenase family protein molybdopterin-binding subunit [Thiocapsa bogorovii]|uniref:xanthine dehydrogenase family protein molybdopterin-binding subunit n=1 Tax=Thiocapsa bogorovii TaxID=521689 RepID=UPI001E285E30|nr:molybdopterin cofactor-binding domain-containing protein [Thiocapsa bogorovii]UHD17394.1 molybdopterin-dependent oxidoreductase [Thiocapsa bogorovii]
MAKVEALKIDWDYGEKGNLTTDSIIEGLRSGAVEDGEVAWEAGDIAEAFAEHRTLVEAEYLQPFQAHVPLEPMNCTAHFRDDGRLEIWAPTQSPSAAYNVAKSITQSKIRRGLEEVREKLLGFRDESVDVHTTLLGGGFGRRLQQDYVAEVVKIAQHYNRPVQLVWTREEDVQHDHYHPMTLHKLKGVLDDNGMPVAWDHLVAGHNVSAEGAAPHPYAIGHSRVSVLDYATIIPKGAWRSVAPHYNVFAVEHFLDELALAGKQDPVELRLKLLGDQPRLRKVLEMVADSANWSNGLGRGVAMGAGVVSRWGSHVAQVVEVAATATDGWRVKKVTCAIDCGIVINPDIVRQQMEGSIVFGLSAATKSKITIKNGRVEQSNFHNYPILGIHETPEIEVLIVQSEEEPGGIGEPGVPPLAPALANALLVATGQPVRELPLKLG